MSTVVFVAASFNLFNVRKSGCRALVADFEAREALLKVMSAGLSDGAEWRDMKMVEGWTFSIMFEDITEGTGMRCGKEHSY